MNPLMFHPAPWWCIPSPWRNCPWFNRTSTGRDENDPQVPSVFQIRHVTQLDKGETTTRPWVWRILGPMGCSKAPQQKVGKYYKIPWCMVAIWWWDPFGLVYLPCDIGIGDNLSPWIFMYFLGEPQSPQNHRVDIGWFCFQPSYLPETNGGNPQKIYTLKIRHGT